MGRSHDAGPYGAEPHDETPCLGLAHLLLLLGAVLSLLGFVSARRSTALGSEVQRWLPWAVVGWGFGAAELVPHLLAAGEAHELAHHEATPVVDVHVVMQTIASPAVGLTGAMVAVAVARAARTRPAWVLAAFAVVGGVLSAAAGPLVVLSGYPAFTILFPFQAGLAVWLVGTAIRLVRTGSRGPRG